MDGKLIDYQSFKERWLGIAERSKWYWKYLGSITVGNKLVGKDFAAGTLRGYKISLGHTRSFIQWKYKIPDLEVTKLDYGFVNSYALC